MKVYIVLEGLGISCPNDNRELIYGVFLSKEDATKCLEHHTRYMDSFSWPKLIRKNGRAEDRDGNIYFQICKYEVDVCRKETWI